MTNSDLWRGRIGDVWAAEWRATDRSFADLSARLDTAILAVAPARGTVMDIGCGAGGTSLALATARPDLTIVGTDLSDALVEAARERGQGQSNLSFRTGDSAAEAAVLRPDMLISRHGVMFFGDADVAFAALARSVPAGAPLVFSCFAAPAENGWVTAPLAAIGGELPSTDVRMPGPFAFADPHQVGALLDRAGWDASAPVLVRYRYIAGSGADPVADALRFFRRIGPTASRLHALDGSARADATAALERVCAQHHADGSVAFPAAAWLWSATRRHGAAS